MKVQENCEIFPKDAVVRRSMHAQVHQSQKNASEIFCVIFLMKKRTPRFASSNHDSRAMQIMLVKIHLLFHVY